MSIKETYVPAHLAIEAMRDNGYKNTAYAVAELIDNSIEANASQIQLICEEKEEEVGARRRRRLCKIGLLDNGEGMTPEVLKMALQFGNGTRLFQRKGIGRFGMGLPASSISQCRRVDVWSWQDGIENAYYIFLDIDKVKKGESTVPEPEKKPLPKKWKDVGKSYGKTGTLVIWSNLDRLMWSKAVTLIDNSENVVGRLYRKFLEKGKTQIILKSFSTEDHSYLDLEKELLPNDPIYLMEKTNCAPPYGSTPMFEPFGGEDYEVKFKINFQEQEHDVFVRLSIAKEDARQNDLSGSSPYGKHAKNNIGISIVRAGREIDLDQSFVIQYDPRERWWGVEVEFPPSLDDLMGVTNNKQSARYFKDIADIVERDLEKLIKAGKTINQVKTELEEEGDPRAPLIELAFFIKNQLSIMRNLIKEQGVGKRAKRRYEDVTAVRKATEITGERIRQGMSGTSDHDQEKPSKVKEEEIIEELIETGYDEEEAKKLAATTISQNLKYYFIETPLEADAFFTVRPRGGAIKVALNTRHPAYENLVEVLEKDVPENQDNSTEERLKKASDGLKLLLMAWARYEDEIPDGQLKENAQNTRNDWGRIAKSFLRDT